MRFAAARLRTHSPALPVAALAALLWLAFAPRTPDLAAQVYRSALFAREGFAVWDGNWYGGHHLLGYSLVSPALGALVGVRLLGVGAAVATALLFDRLATAHWGRRARLGVLWLSVATTCDLLIGRITFGLGVAVGLGALLALQRDRRAIAAVLALATAAVSPVAGLFLALAATALVLGEGSRRAVVIVCLALTAVAALSIAFPEGGRQPFQTIAFAMTLVSSLAVLAFVPRNERVLRIGAALYGLAGLLAFVIPTPMGSNATRLGATFAGPLLVCALWGRLPVRRLARGGLALTLVALATWQWWAPVREVLKGEDDASTAAAYYKPLSRFLSSRPGPPTRVEVPFTQGHWESVFLAAHFPLARGWETQLDTKFNGLFYDGHLTPASYRAWLQRNAVRYVALPDVPSDSSGRAEARLVGQGLPYLRLAWWDSHWRVFEVTGAHAVVSGPARLRSLGPRSFTLQARRTGRVLVRVRFTPYWTVASGSACVTSAGGGWTAVQVRRAGTVRVAARLNAAALIDSEAPCAAR